MSDDYWYLHWKGRPNVGDVVTFMPPDPPGWLGTVLATFYQNGEGGMHVDWGERGTSWANCDRVGVIPGRRT